MLLVFSLLCLFLTVTAESCYSGSLVQGETANPINSSSWYLNLTSSSSCSGKITKYEVGYYVPSNNGTYVTRVAMWEPGDSNTYNMVSGSIKKLKVTIDDKKRQKVFAYKKKKNLSVYIRKGTIIAVHFLSGNILPVLGSATAGGSSVCQLSGAQNEDSLNCTSEHIHTSFVIHAQAKIEIIDCEKLSITHGSVAYINGNDTEYGAIAQYSCNVGFEFSQNGDVYRECKKNGDWNGTSPSCGIVSCGPPNTIPNGEQIGDSYTFGSNMTVSCKPGFELIGNSSITCLANKMWSDKNLTCTVVMCEDLGTLLNGHLSSQNFSYASVVSFTCNLGYVLIGNDKIICHESGNWNGSVPFCVHVNFSDPGGPSNWKKSGKSFSFGSKVTFTCNERYESSDTSGILYCNMIG